MAHLSLTLLSMPRWEMICKQSLLIRIRTYHLRNPGIWCAILELKVRIPRLRSAILGLHKFLLCAEHICKMRTRLPFGKKKKKKNVHGGYLGGV